MYRKAFSTIAGVIRKMPLIVSVGSDSFGRNRTLRLFKAENALVAAGNWMQLAEVRDNSNDSRTAIVEFARRMTNRDGASWMILHAMPFKGSIDRFHHYMGAVLYPTMQLVALGEIKRESKVLVPDCGPMNPLLEAVASHVCFELDFYPREISEGLRDYASIRSIYLRAFDESKNSDLFMRAHNASRVRQIAFALAGIEDGDRPVGRSEGRVLLIDRGPADPYYRSKRNLLLNSHLRKGNVSIAGRERRSVNNMDAIAAELATQFKVERVALEGAPLAQQIRLFNEAALIVAQHGAALNGILWARPKAAVIEILPTAYLERVHFANMATLLGLHHDYVLQRGAHDSVDVKLVSALARDLLGPSS